MGNRKDSAEIDDAAALWAARVEARALSPEEETALDQWLSDDTRHVGAFARARAVSIHMDGARALGSDFFPEPDTD